MKFSILHAGDECGNLPFIVTPERSLSFKQVSERVRAAVHWLEGVGVEPGQTTPFALEASVELRSIIVLLALFELGVPALLVHPRWTEMERARVLKRLELSVQPLPDDFALFRMPPAAAPRPEPDPESCLAVVYTSGSGGTPRGVSLSRRAFLASAAALSQRLNWQVDDRWLLCLPLAHIGGLSILVRCLLARRPLVLEALYNPPQHFRGSEVLRVIEECKVTLVSLVPTQLSRLLESSLRCPSSVRAVILGGAGAPPSLLRRAAHARWPVLCTYGLTEACSGVTLEEFDQAAPERSSGSPLPGTSVSLRDGRIAIRSETLFSGYYPPEETGLPALDAEGWYETQDSGAFDATGRLHVLGRIDDVIVSGGEKVHPLEVEHALVDHPAVAAACVFAVPSETWGQEVAAALVLRAGMPTTTLQAHVTARLAGYKRHQRVAIVEQLPTTASGKISRLRAKQLFQELCVSWSSLDL